MAAPALVRMREVYVFAVTVGLVVLLALLLWQFFSYPGAI
jgi:uncharacterized membrane protein YqhA